MIHSISLVLLFFIGCGSSENKSKDVSNECTYELTVGHTLQFVDSILQGSNYLVEYKLVPPIGSFQKGHALLSASCKAEFQSASEIPTDVFKISAGSCAPIIIQPKNLSNDCTSNFQN